jgi:hypothetical protein
MAKLRMMETILLNNTNSVAGMFGRYFTTKFIKLKQTTLISIKTTPFWLEDRFVVREEMLNDVLGYCHN